MNEKSKLMNAAAQSSISSNGNKSLYGTDDNSVFDWKTPEKPAMVLDSMSTDDCCRFDKDTAVYLIEFVGTALIMLVSLMNPSDPIVLLCLIAFLIFSFEAEALHINPVFTLLSGFYSQISIGSCVTRLSCQLLGALLGSAAFLFVFHEQQDFSRDLSLYSMAQFQAMLALSAAIPLVLLLRLETTSDYQRFILVVCTWLPCMISLTWLSHPYGIMVQQVGILLLCSDYRFIVTSLISQIVVVGVAIIVGHLCTLRGNEKQMLLRQSSDYSIYLKHLVVPFFLVIILFYSNSSYLSFAFLLAVQLSAPNTLIINPALVITNYMLDNSLRQGLAFVAIQSIGTMIGVLMLPIQLKSSSSSSSWLDPIYLFLLLVLVPSIDSKSLSSLSSCVMSSTSQSLLNPVIAIFMAINNNTKEGYWYAGSLFLASTSGIVFAYVRRSCCNNNNKISTLAFHPINA